MPPRRASAKSSARLPPPPEAKALQAPPAARLPVTVLGATGAVGQRFVERLADHPWFVLDGLVASDASAGQSYRAATTWILDGEVPPQAADVQVEALEAFLAGATRPLSPGQGQASRAVAGWPRVAFSALPAGVAGPVETALAAAGWHVFSNARDHRLDDRVPLLLPEVNAGQLALVEQQAGPGSIVTNGNCSAIILALALAPLVPLGIEEVHVTTLQALSGAGHPGVSALDITDNVLPFIPGEEEKMEAEIRKTLGTAFPLHATCTRVPVRDGHTEAVHVRFTKPVQLAHVRKAYAAFRAPPAVAGLPSAPDTPVVLREEPDRPQPRRDRGCGDGMAVSVGRLRLDAAGTTLRMVILGSNTVRGAAGQSILNAEYAWRTGRLQTRQPSSRHHPSRRLTEAKA